MHEKVQEYINLNSAVPNSFYLAGPFFSPEQIARLEMVEQIVREGGWLQCNSPRHFMMLRPNDSWARREKVFTENCKSIIESEFMLANLDKPLDPGTLWEMGFAYACGKRVVGFCLGESKMNVMLAQACEGFLENEAQVREFLQGHQTQYAEFDETGKVVDLNWPVAQRWRREIF